jgi:hypothetical protein
MPVLEKKLMGALQILLLAARTLILQDGALQSIALNLMIIAPYRHQTKRPLILEFSLKPLNLVLWSPYIFQKSSCTVFGGAYEI